MVEFHISFATLVSIVVVLAVNKTPIKMDISFMKNPAGFMSYSIDGEDLWSVADNDGYSLENMILFIGGVESFPIGPFPTADGFVKNIRINGKITNKKYIKYLKLKSIKHFKSLLQK